MKTKNKIGLFLLVLTLGLNLEAYAQTEEVVPKYLVRTTMYWNMDREDFDMEEWKAVEKEYLDKVVMKNEHILGASFFMHQFTEDNTELEYVQSFASWEDIEKADKRNGELISEAWPDDNARRAFFDKRWEYYDMKHSDEIYSIVNGAKPLAEMPTEDLTLYLRISHFAFPEDGSAKEWNEVNTEYVENVIHKNEHVLGYYPSAHFYGEDRTQFIEAFYVKDLASLEKMLDRQPELVREHWSDEDKREAWFKKSGKYFTGKHGDYIYTYVSGLSK